MRRPVDHSLLIALSLSLLAHGGLAIILTRLYAADLRALILQTPIEVRHPPKPPAPLVVSDPQRLIARTMAPPLPMPHPQLPMPRLPLPTPAPLLPPAMEKPVVPPPLARLPDLEDVPRAANPFGEQTGKGQAMHSTPGQQPMQAPRGPQDQAFISRDDVGRGSRENRPGSPGKTGSPAEPRMDAHPVSVQPPATPVAAPAPPRPVETAAIPDPSPAVARGNVKPAATTRPAPVVPHAPPRPETIARAEPPHRVRPATQSVANAAQPGDPGEGDAPSDPAPKTDSESDAFSTTGNAVFRAGKVEARFGRKVKTVRPRLSLAGQYDLLSLSSPEVKMRVKVDDAGRVRDVKVIKSSGSSEVDHPCELAMYEWWFEPPKDADGKPQASEMTWTFTWRR